jgi:Lrp/AsnC family leucine-responsive transcriptional regulator
VPSRPDLDRIDRKVLAVLQRDGRVTNHRLAGLVGLSPSACLARVRRLEQTGVITGYRGSRDRLLKTAR